MLRRMLRKITSPHGANYNADHWLAKGATKTPLKTSRQCLTLSTQAPRPRFTVLLVAYLHEDMKQGSGSIFFGGKLSDNDTFIRVYGYDPEIRVGSSQPKPKRSTQSS